MKTSDIKSFYAAQAALEKAQYDLQKSLPAPEADNLNEYLAFYENFLTCYVGPYQGNGYTVRALFEQDGSIIVVTVQLGRDDPDNHRDAILAEYAKRVSA